MSNTDFSDTSTSVQQKYSFRSQTWDLFLQWTHTSGVSTNFTCRNFTLSFQKTPLAVVSTRNSLGTPWTQSLWGLAIPRLLPRQRKSWQQLKVILVVPRGICLITSGQLTSRILSVFLSCLCLTEDHVIPWDEWFFRLSDFPFSDAKIRWVFAEWCHLICHLSRLMVKECFLLWWWSGLLGLAGFWILCLPGKLRSGNLC